MVKFEKTFFGRNVEVFGKVKFGRGVWIGSNTKIYGPCKIGDNVYVGDNNIIGFPVREKLKKFRKEKDLAYLFNGKGLVEIGSGSTIRTNCIIYSNVRLVSNVELGHNVLIRENVVVKANSLVGSYVVIDGNCNIGSNVSIQTGVYISANTTIEDKVFLGPYCLLLNDKYMKQKPYRLKGPLICKGASIGGNSVIMPKVVVGEGAVIGAGSIVTKNVKPKTIVIGIPAKKVRTVPKSWRIR